MMVLVSLQVIKIHWEDKSMQKESFKFLFNSFKTYYLNVIFPKFDAGTSVYEPAFGEFLKQ